jgi:hypothetical protein
MYSLRFVCNTLIAIKHNGIDIGWLDYGDEKYYLLCNDLLKSEYRMRIIGVDEI